MNKEYQLSPAITGFPANSKVVIAADTSAPVLLALAQNTPFPADPVALASLSASFDGQGDKPVTTPFGQVTFKAGAGARLGLGVLDTSAAVLAKLALTGATDLALQLPDAAGRRYAVFFAGCNVSASASGTHPLGALGSATFGVQASASATFAVISQFAATTGADTVLGTLFGDLRLPPLLAQPSDIQRDTTVLVETAGSLGVQLGAQLGYDFSFVRAAQLGGLAGDVGLKVAARLSSQLGFSVSGRYIICITRPDTDKLRVRLFKLSNLGWRFALNLDVGATPVAPLPGNVDDFVKLVFGVHGQQVIADLKKLELWTDPNHLATDVLSGLAKEQGLALLTRLTGVDAQATFTQARDTLLGWIQQWQSLPATTSAWLWSTFDGNLSPAELATLKTAIKALATGDEAAIKKLLGDALAQSGFDQTPLGRLLGTLVERGNILQLLDRVPAVQSTAQTLQSLLDAGFVTRLQSALAEKLNLQQIIDVTNQTTWAKVDGWLLGRLKEFFGETLGFDQVGKIQQAINGVLAKRTALYQAVREAATKTYEAKFAFAYESATARTALIDATFDFAAGPQVRDAYTAVVRGGAWERILTSPVAGVTLGQGVLTHGLHRQTNVQLTLPFMADLAVTAVTDSLAQLDFQSDGSTVTGHFSLNATSEVKSAGRFASKLALTASLPVIADQAGAGLRRPPGATPTGTWNYTFRAAEPAATFQDVRTLLNPIQAQYFADKFGAGDTSFDSWLTLAGKGAATFGDTLVSLEVLVAGRLLETWFQPRTAPEILAASCAASLDLQVRLRETLFTTYTADLGRLNTGPGPAALLIYASLPPATNVTLDEDGKPVFAPTAPYWDVTQVEIARQLTQTSFAQKQVVTLAQGLAARLQTAGSSLAGFFAGADMSTFTQSVFTPTTMHLNLQALLRHERRIAFGVQQALQDIGAFNTATARAPRQALAALARFGATIAESFGENVRTHYGPSSIRTLGSDLFVVASRALGSAAAQDTTARLNLSTLRPGAALTLDQFIAGATPAATDLASTQVLASGITE